MRATTAGSTTENHNGDGAGTACLLAGGLARRILSAPKRSVLAISGIASDAIREALDGSDDGDRRVLYLKFPAADTADGIVENVVAVLAETALRLWPDWFGPAGIAPDGDDKAGRQTVSRRIAELTPTVPGLLPPWATKAALLAGAKRVPRVRKTSAATELTQLSLAINPAGLVLLFDCSDLNSANRYRQAAVHALEWIAGHGNAAVVALFADMPPFEPPFDRILHGALRVRPQEMPDAHLASESAKADVPWIAPWRGKPHPLSDVELRLFRALGRDAELNALFTFNTLIETVGGARPKVDLLWAEGRLVVELDGYGSHGNRSAFFGDRQRDYELIRSGYIVLRLVNEEIEQDLELAIEKIRTIVALRKPSHARTP